MKNFPSIHKDKNNDDIPNTINIISRNGRDSVHKILQMKNVIELPDVWKRTTNSYISNKSSRSSTLVKNNDMNNDRKLSFDFSSPNQRNNNDLDNPRISLAHVRQNDKMAFTDLRFNISPSPDLKTSIKFPNVNNSTLSMIGFNRNNKNQYLFDVGIPGGFEYWDGSKPNLELGACPNNK